MIALAKYVAILTIAVVHVLSLLVIFAVYGFDKFVADTCILAFCVFAIHHVFFKKGKS